MDLEAAHFELAYSPGHYPAKSRHQRKKRKPCTGLRLVLKALLTNRERGFARESFSPATRQKLYKSMHNQPDLQQSGQKSTTVWSRPETPAQISYYSKHAAERRVFGWISALLQSTHGLLAFASFSAIFGWILTAVPAVHFVIPFASAATLIALHLLFRTTWTTYWYDRLDKDDKTDSPLAVPLAIIVLLLIIEVNGASMFLEGQVKPPSITGTETVEKGYASITSAIDASYRTEVSDIKSVYADKEKAAAAGYERQIRQLKRRPAGSDAEARSIRNSISSLQSQRDKALEPIISAKAADLASALTKSNARKESEGSRRQAAIALIDNGNGTEIVRHRTQMGRIDTYAWLISLCLLTLISALLYRMVKINVKSGILPLRNYTILDAHGSVAERLWTAFSDAFNRRGLQAAVGIHRLLSPNTAITSFDGTVVAMPGTYNTPSWFFKDPEAPNPAPTPAPPAAETQDEDQLKAKVFRKVMEEAAKGQLLVTPEMLELELQKAKTMNGSYMASDLGKPNPSVPAAVTEGPHPTAELTTDKYLQNLAHRIQGAVGLYDLAIAHGDKVAAMEASKYLNNPEGPIMKESKRLGIAFGTDIEDDEVVVWRTENPSHKVPVSLLSEAALSAVNEIPATDTQIRFKSDLNQFSDEIKLIRNGDLIGISYKKEDGRWSPLGVAAVRSRLKIAQKNAGEEDPSPKVLRALGKWTYAMDLLNKEKSSTNANKYALDVERI
jgi:hypothetical protein